ncbi:DUF3311 domain-containing protein [Frankia gtarii]|uniref:DUF3311 domain-containing protein n=1 Tax=Frankia gtarii TaxID=2950102 RepID=UPI0021BEDCBE|nr:DUF3311 domain-containing protein [Frankia gtarii]
MAARGVVAVVLTAQVVALLLVGAYARRSPRLWGFPFFYWYTLLWLLIGAATMAACTWLLGRTAPAGAAVCAEHGATRPNRERR